MRQSYATLEEALLAADDRRTERPFRCHIHGGHGAHASVNVTKGLWVCYSCGAAGKADGEVIETDTTRLQDDVFRLLEETDDVTLADSMMSAYMAGDPHPYWRERYTYPAIQHFQLGSDPVSGRPCYPLRGSGGQLLGVVMRNLDRQPKYKYPRGVKAHTLLWNYSPAVRDHVVLVEGAMDVIACWEVGVEAFGIFGSHLGQAQMDLLAKTDPKHIHLAFDNDHAGRKATDEAIERLESRGFYAVDALDWRAHPFHKDVAELEHDTRKKTLHQLLAV